ncbi:MAG TPA: hypothetical protein VIG99_17630 [Myxococcaceae bacterium]|jgi:hypothetical protein
MIGAVATLLVLLASPEPVPDELLKKLADRDARLTRLYKEGAVTMTSRVEELDKGGKVQHTQTVVLRLTQKDGKPHGEVVRASRDGQDVTEEERKTQAEKQARADEDPKGKKDGRMSMTLPFDAATQPKYQFQLLGPDAKNPSLSRIGFGPRGKPDKDIWAGEAVVDPSSGEVKWMKQRPSDLPAFVDRLEMVFEFGASTSEGPAISTLQMEGEGGLPFFKKKFRVMTTFSDYGPK